MPHHTNDETPCPLCEGKLGEAHPYLQTWFHGKKVSYPTLHISWAYRDCADQEKAFAAGETRLHWPHSAHNHTNGGVPNALALDLFSLSEDGVAVFPFLLYSRINNENVADKLPIRWGGNFKSIGDSDHFEFNAT